MGDFSAMGFSSEFLMIKIFVFKFGSANSVIKFKNDKSIGSVFLFFAIMWELFWSEIFSPSGMQDLSRNMWLCC